MEKTEIELAKELIAKEREERAKECADALTELLKTHNCKIVINNTIQNNQILVNSITIVANAE